MRPDLSRRFFLGTVLRGAAGLLLAPHWRASAAFRSPPAGVVLERACHVMGSTFRITAHAESRAHAIEAISAAFAAAQRVDLLLSVYREESAISRINRAAGRAAVSVEEDVLRVLAHSLSYTRELPGRFDITLEPLMRAWGFRAAQGSSCRPPADRDILRLLEAVGPDQVACDLQEQTVGLRHSACALDLGGIGVGFALDQAVAALRDRGIHTAFLNHSGDAYAMGCPAESEGWSVGIPDPRDSRRIAVSFTITDRAVSTSGSYENFREYNGHAYGHLLDPRTGRPADSHLGATVIAETALDADVLSTAAFCSDNDVIVDECASASGAEVIRFTRAPSGTLTCSHHVPTGHRRVPLHTLED